MKDLITQDNIEETAKQIVEIRNHGFVQSRLVLVESYHQIGQLIMNLPSRYEAVPQLARLTKLSSRTLYRAAQFYSKFPDMSFIPEGNNLSWSLVISKYLQEPNPVKEQKQIENLITCPKCGYQFKNE